MTQLRYAIVDVFAERPLQGNAAAVVFDADALDGARMQALAREFNLSETAFILKPKDAANTAHVRIFTPMTEVPFAGHPNIGGAFALANDHPLPSDALTFEEEAGLVRLTLDRAGDRVTGASLVAPQTVSTVPGPDVAATAAALSLNDADIVTTTHPPITASVGLEFLFVELASEQALSKARSHLPAFDRIRDSDNVLGVHLYVKRGTPNGARIDARNLSPYDGITEDPATGSATAALCALLADLDTRSITEFKLEAIQGEQMGRRSVLHASARKGQPPRISGQCVAVMSGTISL
jgi:trans-2,3-dihydro-3-hydroxyanthranilate isomerase